ncbi:ABC transporter permease, partial [Clostridioides difficile]
GLAIVVVVSAFNFLSDALQVALDPKLMTSQGKSDKSYESEVRKTAYEYSRG